MTFKIKLPKIKEDKNKELINRKMFIDGELKIQKEAFT